MNQNIANLLFQPTKNSTNNNVLRFLSTKDIAYCLGVPATQMQNIIQPLLESQQIITFIFRNKILYGTYLDNLFVNNPNIQQNWLKLQNDKINQQACKVRTCYNHLAGTLGVDLYSFFARKNYFNINKNLNTTLSKKGKVFLNKLGINCNESQPIINCLDWTERRFHIGGNLGKEIYTLCHMQKLVEEIPNSRALIISNKGQELWQHLQ